VAETETKREPAIRLPYPFREKEVFIINAPPLGGVFSWGNVKNSWIKE